MARARSGAAATGGGDYGNDAKKMLATKNDATIKALVRGIRRKERARDYIQAELDLAAEEDRDVRRPLIGMLNQKVSQLEAADGTEDEDADGDDQ